ncbi:MAG TPA: hypothetical protein VN025_17330 [Candidatus Dormibacteraeota bacterium]|nr:hypothetical protein [Candidatus Dormibacteraeota bacterium]
MDEVYRQSAALVSLGGGAIKPRFLASLGTTEWGAGRVSPREGAIEERSLHSGRDDRFGAGRVSLGAADIEERFHRSVAWHVAC